MAQTDTNKDEGYILMNFIIDSIPHEGIGISLLPLTALSRGDGLKTLCEGKAVKVVDH